MIRAFLAVVGVIVAFDLAVIVLAIRAELGGTSTQESGA